MTTFEKLLGVEDEGGPVVEIVTLTPDDLASGATIGRSRPFPDLSSAMAFAGTLTTDEREASWARTKDGTLTLAEAEAILSARREKLGTTPGVRD
jgi:hypothetical protein